jgi:cytoskeletal protein CcmA (bactofilin family)
MWKRDEVPAPLPNEPKPERHMPHSDPPRSTPVPGERATIGRSITIKGEVSGDEDLLIQGQVDGSVDLKQQAVTVGREGKVKAHITGRMVTVEGEVQGNLKADEQVILRSSARVQGDITAPRVVLEDGATFRGGIDMGTPSTKGDRGADASSPVVRKQSEPLQSPSALSSAGPAPKKDSADTVSKAGA